MALFKIPKRTNANIDNILAKVATEETPKIKLKGTSLLSKIEMIRQTVEKNLGSEKGNYLLIDNDSDWLDYCKNVIKDGICAIDTETNSLDVHKCSLVGVCIYSPSQKPAYIPCGHISPITEQRLANQVSIEAISKGLARIEQAGVFQIYHNAYYDKCVIYCTTNNLMTVGDDTLIMSQLLNENESHSLKYLYNKYCEESEAEVHVYRDLFGAIPLSYLPPEIVFPYGARDSLMTYELHKFLKPFLTTGTPQCEAYSLEKVAKLYDAIEKPLISVLCDMKLRGINFDFERAQQLKEKYTRLKKEAEEQFNKAVEPYKQQIIERQAIKHDIEYPVCYNSPQQVKILVYDILKSGVIFQKEPTGTGKHVIDTVLSESKYKDTPLYYIMSALSEVKKYDKLIGTFIDKLTDDAKSHDGKIYCSFNQLGARTGRLSSSDPNLQQCPSRNDDIRNMFIPGEGRVFISMDYSQQEMLCVASLADSEKMINSFRLGRDIYSHVAHIAFNKPYEECTEFDSNGNVQPEGKKLRKLAKAICLGVCYGKGDKAISEDLHVTLEKASEIRESVLGAFPALKRYLEYVVEFCKETGYVEDYFGRRRRLPEINLPKYEISFKPHVDDATKKYYTDRIMSALKQARGKNAVNDIIYQAKSKGIEVKDNTGIIAQKVRNSFNSPVQGTAATIIKIAMNNLFNSKRLAELDAHLILSIHDECVLTCPEENVYEVLQEAEKLFLDAGNELKAKLRCDIEIARCWAGEVLTLDENHNLIKKA